MISSASGLRVHCKAFIYKLEQKALEFINTIMDSLKSNTNFKEHVIYAWRNQFASDNQFNIVRRGYFVPLMTLTNGNFWSLSDWRKFSMWSDQKETDINKLEGTLCKVLSVERKFYLISKTRRIEIIVMFFWIITPLYVTLCHLLGQKFPAKRITKKIC